MTGSATNEDDLAVRDIFDVDKCIELHNELIELACKACPELQSQAHSNVFSLAPHRIASEGATGQQTEENTLTHDEWRKHLGQPMIQFLENIRVSAEPGQLRACDTSRFQDVNGCDHVDKPHMVQSSGTLMHPLAHSPCLDTFSDFAEFLEHCESINGSILLYHERETGNTGGVFVDLVNDYWASWIHVIGGPERENRKNWHPLDEILRRWKRMWEVDKFRAFKPGVDPEHTQHELFALASWVERDVERTLESWTRLLDALEARISSLRTTNRLRRDDQADQQHAATMVSDEILKAWQFPSFGRELFRRARVPIAGIKFIAPSITYMTDELFEEIQKGPRTDLILRREEMGMSKIRPMLMFPAASDEPRMAHWEAAYNGFGLPWDFAQDKRAGLYLDTVYDTWGDGAQFLNRDGESWFFKKRRATCPWASGTRPASVVSEILDAFSTMIECGADENGVRGGIEWWIRSLSDAKEDIEECLHGNWFETEY